MKTCNELVIGLSRSGDGIETTFNAFKIPESNFLVFEATVNTCRGGCKPVRFQFFGLNCEVHVVLCQISIFCHQLTQNTKTDFLSFTKIDTNCSDNEFLKQFVYSNLRKSDKIICHIVLVNW